MDVQDIFLIPCPVGVVPEGVYPNILKCRVPGKPFLRPVMVNGTRLAPCLPRAPSESVYEDQVDAGFCGSMNQTQSQSPMCIPISSIFIGILYGSDRIVGGERGRQLAVLVSET